MSDVFRAAKPASLKEREVGKASELAASYDGLTKQEGDPYVEVAKVYPKRGRPRKPVAKSRTETVYIPDPVLECIRIVGSEPPAMQKVILEALMKVFG